MDEILGQLGGLLLGSVPTIIFIVLLYFIYTSLVHKPLVAVLAERRSLTEGAVEKARADIAKAEARTAEYEQRLREARMALFKSQESRRQQLYKLAPPPLPKRAPRRRVRLIRRGRLSSKIKCLHSPDCRQRVEGLRLKLFARFCNRRASSGGRPVIAMSDALNHHAMHAPRS